MYYFCKKAILILLLVISSSVFGQLNRSYEDWYIGLHGGMNSLWGDVTDNDNHFLPGGPFQQGFYQDRKFMWGVSVGKNLSPIYAMRAQFISGPITSHTVSERQFMTGTIQDYTLSLSVDFIDLFDWSTKSDWDFYGFIGLGFSKFRSQLYSSIVNDSVNQPLINFSPNDSLKFYNNKYTTTFSIPFGLGVNYKIGRKLVVNVESSLRYLNTDWLDGIVSNKRSFEGFGYLSVGVSYRFNLPRGGSTWSRKTNHGFDAHKENSGAAYRNKRHNGNMSTDPFNNIGNKKSSIKGRRKSKGKTFKTPK
ncbi:MAG: DUF6089 family protein [Bacteroidota bacterium]